MPIITIFGGTFVDDEELAKNVARPLDYRCVGRDLLADAARRCDVPEAKLDEIIERSRAGGNVGRKICGCTGSRSKPQ